MGGQSNTCGNLRFQCSSCDSGSTSLNGFTVGTWNWNDYWAHWMGKTQGQEPISESSGEWEYSSLSPFSLLNLYFLWT